MKRLLFALIAVVLAAGVAQAQSPAPRVSFSGSYSFVRTDLADAGGGNDHAIGAAIGVRLTSKVYARADYLKLNNATLLLFGPEYRRSLKGLLPSSDFFKSEKFEVFATAQGGNSRSQRPDGTKDNDFAYSVGGGLDFTDLDAATGGQFTIRAFEFKYVHSTLWQGGRSFKNNAVLQTGLNFRF